MIIELPKTYTMKEAFEEVKRNREKDYYILWANTSGIRKLWTNGAGVRRETNEGVDEICLVTCDAPGNRCEFLTEEEALQSKYKDLIFA